MGVVKFGMDGVTKLVSTSELGQSSLLPEKQSRVSRQDHLLTLRNKFNIVLRPQGISTYYKAVRLISALPVSGTELLCVQTHCDGVLGTLMIQIVKIIIIICL